MAEFFDESTWQEAIQHPDWYLRLEGEYEYLQRQAQEGDERRKQAIKDEVRAFFEEAINKGELHLAATGPDFDAERQQLDTVVIHHTSAEPGIMLRRLNVIHLLNLYRPHYTNPPAEEGYLREQPIYSNHFRDGRPVFYAYHWLVRGDGMAERLLGDEEIGWQAGDWGVNCRSVAVCFDDDLSDKEPAPEALEGAARIIREYYDGLEVLGHCEVNPKTVCPGELFAQSWKYKLENYVRSLA